MFDPREEAHIKKRDKKSRNKYQMVVWSGGKTLARVLVNIRRKKKKK